MIDMINEFVPYEIALELKQLGFTEPCLASYYHAGRRLDICEYINHGEYTVLAPTHSQAFRWLRENYPRLNFGFDKIHPESKNYHYHINYKWEFFEGSYEEAESECLKKLIEIVKYDNQRKV